MPSEEPQRCAPLSPAPGLSILKTFFPVCLPNVLDCSLPFVKRLCVFCGSSQGLDPVYAEETRRLGRLLAARKIALVYGGGRVGLMGTLADAVLAGRGEVIGIIPQALVDKELAHQGLTQLRIVLSMHERKALMADFADGFLALPGGYGTLDEFCEVLTWSQLGLHRKPCGLLNVNHFYDPFLAQVNMATKAGFIVQHDRGLFEVADDPEVLLNWMDRARPPAAPRWIDRREV